ncbi:MAG: PEP-CTERM sorting domain-containing protein [Burkholderiales bacterium]|nr:PEP-CTERM sorting domain-containing protein [Burkholderiales bacterium]
MAVRTGDVLLAPVPEPETYAMLLAGLGVMGAVARRRKAKQA